MPKAEVIKVVNTITGEYMEFAPGSLEDVVSDLVDIKGLKESIERAEAKLKALGDEMLGDDKGFDGDGWRLERRSRNPQEYNPIKLRAALNDEDLFMEFVKVSRRDVDGWRKEMVERGELDSELNNALNQALEAKGNGSTSLYLIRI